MAGQPMTYVIGRGPRSGRCFHDLRPAVVVRGRADERRQPTGEQEHGAQIFARAGHTRGKSGQNGWPAGDGAVALPLTP